jgi:hypothetical protein
MKVFAPSREQYSWLTGDDQVVCTVCFAQPARCVHSETTPEELSTRNRQPGPALKDASLNLAAE